MMSNVHQKQADSVVAERTAWSWDTAQNKSGVSEIRATDDAFGLCWIGLTADPSYVPVNASSPPEISHQQQRRPKSSPPQSNNWLL
jgi:hypothetical protein